jgi:hypothetical protein
MVPYVNTIDILVIARNVIKQKSRLTVELDILVNMQCVIV